MVTSSRRYFLAETNNDDRGVRGLRGLHLPLEGALCCTSSETILDATMSLPVIRQQDTVDLQVHLSCAPDVGSRTGTRVGRFEGSNVGRFPCIKQELRMSYGSRHFL